jgi:peptide/nickel transport system ATP-binding protein
VTATGSCATPPRSRTMAEQPLLAVRELTKVYEVRRSVGRVEQVRGVDGVSFDVHRSSTVGLVGESGSGKSTIGRCVLGLQSITSGTVHLDGVRIDGLPARAMRAHRRRLQMVFQMPQRSFDPLLPVAASVEEPLRTLRGDLDARGRLDRIRTVLEAVSLAPELWQRRPAELSGGQLQRAAIARALVTEPDLVFLDEPTSALDMSVRGEVLALLAHLRDRFEVAMVYVSHDLDAVQALADELIVLYLGEVVERGPAAQVLASPRHPYTQALLAAGRFDPNGPVLAARGEGGPGDGCRLRTRCPLAEDACAAPQPLLDLGDGVSARCWRAAEAAR